MSGYPDSKRYLVDGSKLPALFPTQAHDPKFWEYLGRTIATFGFLEEVLGKAIFAFTATKPYDQHEAEEALRKWHEILERALTDPLSSLINAYSSAVRDHPKKTIENLDELIASLKSAARIRNVLCHGSWRMPDESGRSLPFFVNRKREKFDTPIDVAFLEQTQRAVAEMASVIVSTVTHMGYRFPGSSGPGTKFW